MQDRFDELPIFPLPRVVLMPGALLPLHVFEPRYRALVAWCMERDAPLGIATLRPGFEADYEGSPPVYPELGVGRLARVRTLPDGRSHVVVEFAAAARIVEELPTAEPFRVVRALAVRPDPTGFAEAAVALRRLLDQLGLGLALPGGGSPIDDAHLIDALAIRVIEATDERRRYLGAPTLRERARMVSAHLATMALATQEPGEA